MRRDFFTLMMTLLAALTAAADTFTGRVVDEAQTPVPFANVVLDSTRYGVATDLNGFYLINNVISRSDIFMFSKCSISRRYQKQQIFCHYQVYDMHSDISGFHRLASFLQSGLFLISYEVSSLSDFFLLWKCNSHFFTSFFKL